MKKIAIYGASGHGKVVADIARLNGYDDIIFIDDSVNEHLSFADFMKLDTEIPIAMGIGDNKIREKLYLTCIKKGLKVKTLVHPSAVLADNIVIGNGTVIMANVVVNSNSTIGTGCILNTASVIEHDNTIGNFVHISPNAVCAGGVKIGTYTHIGIGSSLIQGITVGSSSVIGAGSVVVKNIDNNTLAYGNPCKKKKELT